MSQSADAPASRTSTPEGILHLVLRAVQANADKKLEVAAIRELALWNAEWESLNESHKEQDELRAECVRLLNALVMSVDSNVRLRCLDDVRVILPLVEQIFAWRQPLPEPMGGFFPYHEREDGTRVYVLPQSHSLRTAMDRLRDLSHTFGVLMHRFVEQWTVWMSLAVGEDEGDEQSASNGEQRRVAKRSTERGEARVKLIAALTQYHQYAQGSSLNLKPIGNNELAELADVDKATASAFLKKQFGGHSQYVRHCQDAGKLVVSLKLLNDEYTPHELFGKSPPSERDRADD